MDHNNNNSYGTTWAEQWDYNPNPLPDNNKKSSGGGSKYGKKMGEGFDKTKSVASTGMKKVKEGTTLGFNWIKDKYNKRAQKH